MVARRRQAGPDAWDNCCAGPHVHARPAGCKVLCCLTPTCVHSLCPLNLNGEQPPAEFHGPVQIPIEGELDLHTFRPQDVKEVVSAYLEACRERGILKVRIIHGKGIGTLRQTVHAILSRSPEVQSFALAGESLGSWGATIVCLRPQSADEKKQTS